jgi:hypothetical protein
MQRKVSDMKQVASELEEKGFEEAVRVSQLTLTWAFIQCLQMRSVFWKGVTFLNESGSDVGHCPGTTVGHFGTSEDTKGFTEVPKNVTLLRPVISKLMDKVAQSVT